MTVDIVTTELDFEQKRITHPSPLILDLKPINNQTTFNLNATNTVGPISFLVPSRVLALNESVLEWSFVAPASVAGTTYNWFNANMGCMLSRVTITSQNTNQVVFDLPNFDRYMTTMVPISQREEVLKTSYSSYVAPLGSVTTAIPPVYSAGTTPTVVASGVANTVSTVSMSNAIANPDGLNQYFPGGFEAKRELFVGQVGTSAGAQNYDVINVAFKLGSIPFSVCALRKLLYFSGEQLQIDLYFNNYNKFCWNGSSATNPSSSPISIVPVTASGVTYPAISNLRLKLQVEQNQEITSEIVRKVQSSGMELQLAYPFCYKSNLTGLSASQTIQLSRGYGSRCLGVVTAPFNNTESLNTAQDRSLQQSLLNNVTAMNYNTYLDNVPILTNTNIDVYGDQTYLYNKQHLYGSLIKSNPQYYIDFAIIDSFIKDSLCQFDVADEDGISLETMRQWSIQVNGAGTGASLINYYFFILAQKQLVLTGSGVQVV